MTEQAMTEQAMTEQAMTEPVVNAPVVNAPRRATETLGDLDGPVAKVDRAGTVALTGARWRVAWAVGAEDRWHVAADEAAVRSRLIDDMPATATLMRVPGGDVVLQAAAGRAAAGRAAGGQSAAGRAAGGQSAAGRVVVLEFTNDTQVPVSLAVAVAGSINAAAVSGTRLLVDGRIAVDLGRAPGGAAAVADGNVWRVVQARPPTGDCEARSRAGQASAAVVVPLAPRVPLRITVPATVLAERESAHGSSVQERIAIGSPLEIAAGWRAVVQRAARVDLPDEAAVKSWRRGIAASILAAGCSDPAALARAAVVLDRVGLTDEADRAREALIDEAGTVPFPPPVAAATLRALASRRLRTGRVSGLAELAGPLAELAGDRLDALTLEQVASVLESEAPAAARDARRLLAETPSAFPRPDAAAQVGAGESVARRVAALALPDAAAQVDRLSAALGHSAAFGGDGLAGVEALLDCLVAETPDHLVMLPVLPPAWWGVAVDVRSLATRHGVLSFSVRWHGPRPAVLWNLQPGGSLGLPAPALRCGLDGSWTSADVAGEVLLGVGVR